MQGVGASSARGGGRGLGGGGNGHDRGGKGRPETANVMFRLSVEDFDQLGARLTVL